MLLSVIVPIYNMEDYLRQCLDSIVNQTYPELEIILVDDGSTDSSLQICREYAEKDSRILVVEKENGGLVSARKEGIKHVLAEYISFVDPDDWLALDTYEVLVDILAKTQTDILCCGFINENKGISTYYTNDVEPGIYEITSKNDVLYRCMLYNDETGDAGIKPSVWSKIFKRQVVEGVLNNIDEGITIGEDMACTYPALLNAKNIVVTDFCGYHYRRRDDSMSSNIREAYFETIGLLYKYLYRTFQHESQSEFMIP